MTTVMMDVADIRFTQEHVYDSFNANSSKAGGTVELIEAILAGQKTPSDLPLIRVAPKRGAYWCVDNRRLFVYKHCQLGKIPVVVYDWKDMREFQLKWVNGLATRGQSSEGRRVGVLQRTETPFPRSAVAEPTLSQILEHMPPEQQRKHDARIASLRRQRQQREAAEAAVGASNASVEAADSLRGLLLPAVSSAPNPAAAGETEEASKRRAGARKKRRRGEAAQPEAKAAEGAGIEGSELPKAAAVDDSEPAAPEGGLAGAKKRRKKAKVAKGRGDNPAEPAEGAKPVAEAGGEVPATKGKRRKLSGEKGAAAAAAIPAAAEVRKASPGPAASAGNAGPVKLTVALAQEDSSDEAYNVEVTAM